MLQGERKVYTAHVPAHAVLSRDLFNELGHLVLPKETELTHAQISRLKQLGVLELWICDEEQQPYAVNRQAMKAYESTASAVQELFSEARVHKHVNLERTAQSLRELEAACRQESNFLNLMLNLRTVDEYTYQHSIGVGLLCRKIGEWLGLSDRDLQDLFLAGTLHDIGKSQVNETVLKKPGRLTSDEYEHIKKHTVYGYQILSAAGVSEHIACVALNHHERIDGGGYPRGLAGREIDLFSRICGVADVFNAMTTRRVYRDAASHYKVLEEVQKNAFGELDPGIVAIFLQKMTAYLVGNTVELSDGTVGTVVLVPPHHPTRPLLQTATGFLDLQARKDLYIEQVKAV